SPLRSGHELGQLGRTAPPVGRGNIPGPGRTSMGHFLSRNKLCLDSRVCRYNGSTDRAPVREVLTMTSISVMSGSSTPHTLELVDFRVSEVVFPTLLSLPMHSHARACFAVVLGGSVRKSFRSSTRELLASGTVTMP